MIDEQALETMTSTQQQASTSQSESDWRLRIFYEKNAAVPTAAELAAIRCPFEVTPEDTPTIPAAYTENVRHYTNTTGPGSLPWAGYYATYFGRKLAVANAFGVWFEIRRRENTWEAIRPTRNLLKLNHSPLEGIDMAALSESGERISVTRLYGTRSSTSDSESEDEDASEEDLKPTIEPRSSQTERGRGSRRLRSTQNNPITLADDNDDMPTRSHIRLKGRPPNKFDGDRSRTLTFLTEFNQFMLTNREATIARNPISKSAYFLSLIDGPMVEGWCFLQSEWLDKVEDPTAWQELEQKFKKDFVDHAGPELAQQEFRKLRMKDGNVDKYIADFEELARRAGHNVDDPANLQLFAQGLPVRLAENCIKLEDPKAFEQWAKAAQKHQKIWREKQSLRKGKAQGQPTGRRAPTRQFTPRDPNAMDTSATARKAIIDVEQPKHRQEGRRHKKKTRAGK